MLSGIAKKHVTYGSKYRRVFQNLLDFLNGSADCWFVLIMTLDVIETPSPYYCTRSSTPIHKRKSCLDGAASMARNASVVEENSMLTLQDKNQELQECMCLLSFLKDVHDNRGRRDMGQFLILSMAGTTERF